jgi:anti-sigma factor RsiW
MKNPAREKVLPLLSAYVDGELTPSERQGVEAHLRADDASARLVEDLRAGDALMRHALELEGDQVDWKAFADGVLEGLEPKKLPLLERWRLELSELFTWQRGPLVAGALGAVLAVLIAIPLTLRFSTPEGYGAARVRVQTVAVEEAAQVKPVVMETEDGDAVIWMVDAPPVEPTQEEQDQLKQQQRDEELSKDPPARKGEL